MRGVRGGLKDQIKGFREFLIRRKKKRKKQVELDNVKKKNVEIRKKESEVFDYCEDLNIKLDQIIIDIYEEEVDYVKINEDLNLMQKDKNNVSFFDKIEEVKEKVELEILYEEIIEEDVNDKSNEKDAKIDRFIYLSEKNINISNDVKEVNHYYNRVSNVFTKHVKNKEINKANDKNIMDSHIKKEENLLLLANNRLKEITNNDIFESTQLNLSLEKSKVNDIEVIDDIEDQSINNIEVIDDIENRSIDNIPVLVVNEQDEKEILHVDEKVDTLIQDSILDEHFNLGDSLEEYVTKELEDYKKDFFDFREFDIINQSVKSQILISETKVNKLRSEVESIKNLFIDKSFFDKLMDFGSNMFNLGRGLIGKYVFNNRLVGRLNSEILINNSLKGIHRVFVDDKKEVPYIVFKGFEDEINDKKDCVAKIIDICDDSLSEIDSLKNDFLSKYSNINNEQVRDFFNKIEMYQKQITNRKEEVKRIQERVLEKYRMNKQMIKVKK